VQCSISFDGLHVCGKRHLEGSFQAQAQDYADRPGYWHYGGDWGWGHMLFGSLMMILFWGGIIVLIVLAVRWLGGGSAGDARR
jgi:putative membrane protein